MSIIGREVTVTVDRAMGSRHPKYPDIIYPINYGYVGGVTGGDGDAQDAYILGADTPLELFTGIVIAIVRRLNDVEDKWVVAPRGVTFTKEEIAAQLHFQEQYFKTEIIM